MGKYLAVAPWINAIRFRGKNGFETEVHCFLPEVPTVYTEDNRNQEWSYAAEAVKTLIERGFATLASPLWPLRLPSGGSLDIITDSTGRVFIPMEQRDDKPGIRAPGFQNPWLGYPESLEDCLSGNFIKRETNEEGLYMCKGSILIPTGELERKTALSTAEKLGLLNTRMEILNTDYDEEACRDTFFLYQGSQRKIKIKCSFSWYPTPDLIQVRNVYLPAPIDEVIIYHESKREIIVVAKNEIKRMAFGDTIEVIRMTTRQDGKRVADHAEITFKPTSSLKAVLGQLGMYPLSWEDEVFNLLWSKDFQKLLKDNPGKDPFTLENQLWQMGKHP
jgi:hypothetical protein